MKEFKKMKILVENNLDEIVVELEKRGYKKRCVTVGKVRFVFAEANGFYDIFYQDYFPDLKTTTLAELKEM